MSFRNTGPTTSDCFFFTNCLNPDCDGMTEVIESAVKGDYVLARRLFADSVRNQLLEKRNIYLSIPYELPENEYKMQNESDEEACKRVMRHTLVSVGIPMDYGENKPIDWKANPTVNGYKEWVYQLNRHNDIKMLAHEYVLTGNLDYAKAALEIIYSWIQQEEDPGDVPGGDSESWRTIECGIRMGANWQYILFALIETPFFKDDLLIDWYKSVYEQGMRLERNRTSGNWLIMEMNGLAQIGILYPQLRASEGWLTEAWKTMQQILDEQFYPDGFQYELTTEYHNVSINNYQRLIQVAQAFHSPVPGEVLKKLEKAVNINIQLMMPDGSLPDINDGTRQGVGEIAERLIGIFPRHEQMRWLLTEGKEGSMPPYKSIALPYAGIVVMRDGWNQESTWALFDAGPFGKGHQHEDKLSLMVWAEGRLLLTEGGNYAYDASPMRNYVISTRAHNTALVDDMEQKRRSDYCWNPYMICKPANFIFKEGENYDYAAGIYEEGYAVSDFAGKEEVTSVDSLSAEEAVHVRTVLFIKNPEPDIHSYLIVIDRFFSRNTHQYKILWHMDDEITDYGEDQIRFEHIDISCSGLTASLRDKKGQTEPIVQGFAATGVDIQGMYKEVHCIEAEKKGDQCRVVTVLSPFSEKKPVRLRQVSAGSDVFDRDICLVFENGREFHYIEDIPESRHQGYSIEHKNSYKGEESE